MKHGPGDEAGFANPKRNDNSFFRPVECYSDAKLSGHTPVYQLASQAFKLRRSPQLDRPARST